MNLRNLTRLIASMLLLLCLENSPARAQTTSALTPPSTRIEYHLLRWMVFHSPNCHLYYPTGSDSLAALISSRFPAAQALIASRMGGASTSTPQIVIYPSLQTRYESSIGSRDAPLKLPTFVAKGSRIVLYYNGSYEDLEAQLRLALARSAWEAALRRNVFAAQAKGKVRGEETPYWFSEGAQLWFAQGWILQQDEQLRYRFETSPPADFYQLVNGDPALAGAGFCYFLSQRYMPRAPRGVLEQLRSGKSLDRALRLMAKRRPDSLYADCYNWYRQRYSARTDQINTLATNPHNARSGSGNEKLRFPSARSSRAQLRQCRLSPDGSLLALVMDIQGHKRAVYIRDQKTGKAKKLVHYQLPPWMSGQGSDFYPLLYWESGQVLQVTMPYKSNLKIRKFSLSVEQGSGVILPLIDGASAALPLGNESWLLSAWLQGQGELVRYAARGGRYQPLTNDAADELEPAFQNNGSTAQHPDAVFFSSVRKGDTAYGQEPLPLRQGIYERSATGIRPVITDTLSYVRFSHPAVIDDQHILMQAGVHGRSRIAVLDLRLAEWRQKGGAQATQQALQFIGDASGFWQYDAGGRQVIRSLRQGDSLLLRTEPVDSLLAIPGLTGDTSAGPWLQDYRRAEALRRAEDSILRAAKASAEPSFLDGVFKAAQGPSKQATPDSTANRFSARKAQPYFVQLYSAYFSAQVNNDNFVNRFQPYQAFQGTFKVPEVGGMISAGLSDLFEHHHLSFAYRLPAGSEGSMFFAKYGNTAKRLDWSLAYYRNVESIKPDPARAWVDADGKAYPGAAKVKTHYYELGLNYPLSYYTAVSGTIAARKDRTVFLATNTYSLTFPALEEFWISAHPQLETKHLRPTIAGLYRGWYAKAQADVFKTFTGSEAALAGVGMAAQWHQPLYQYITLVAKAQAGYSGGDRRLLYVLGGVDNNLTPRIDSSVHFSQAAPYAYQTLVTPLRGYLQNGLYGSRYALLNADVYAPVFETLIPLETAFPSINKLQIGLFSDLAAAGGERLYSTASKGWCWSYGFSARTILAGYPLRFDMAWPGSFGSKPVWYLSLSL